jgi:hypothetical protein
LEKYWSPQVMTVVTTFPKPSKKKDLSNGQPDPNLTTGTHLWLGLFNYVYLLSPVPNSLSI